MRWAVQTSRKGVLEGIRNRVRLHYEEVEPGLGTIREPGSLYGLSDDFERVKTASKGIFRPSKQG